MEEQLQKDSKSEVLAKKHISLSFWIHFMKLGTEPWHHYVVEFSYQGKKKILFEGLDRDTGWDIYNQSIGLVEFVLKSLEIDLLGDIDENIR